MMTLTTMPIYMNNPELTGAIDDPDKWSEIRQSLAEHLSKTPSANFGTWQATDVSKSQVHEFHELMNVVLQFGVSRSSNTWADIMRPNMPWAEDHFAERVSGAPANPGEQFKHWPWYAGGVEGHKTTGIFSHTYMERYWPKHAGNGLQSSPAEEGRYNQGIRWAYGDLNDVIKLLIDRRYTRQAYLPVWFPEDTGAVGGTQRVPCSLGYHFMIRNGELHCWYYLRSCDFIRYLADDVYMTGRLMQWIVNNINKANDDPYTELTSVPEALIPGQLNVIISSLHCFKGDEYKLYNIINGMDTTT